MKRTIVSNRLPLLLLAAALSVAMVVLYLASRDDSSAGYFEDVALLREMHQLDARWELDVIKARYGMNASYDTLVNPLAELQRLPAQLSDYATLRYVTDMQRLEAAADAFERALNEKSRLIESFKSHNAVLSNSMAYLPIAAKDIEEEVEAGRLSAEYAVLANRIVLAEFTVDELVEEESALGEALRSFGSLAPPKNGSEQVELFLAHARKVLLERQRVGELLEGISAVPTAARLEAIQVILGQDQQKVLEHLARRQILLLLLAGGLGVVMIDAARRLARGHAIIRKVNDELTLANDTLEERVRERTQALQQMQGQLVASARQAGMAEVASNVLHNVGNVLNSVSVCAALAQEQVRQSRLTALGKAVHLLQQHEDRLDHFLMHDERGRRLPAYLAELARTADEERTALLEELVQLTGRVDHIKEIVALQQSNAGAACLYEECDISSVVDEALRISADSLQRHRVTVRKLYEVLPKAQLDRHRVLQILVNLLSNAKRAMSEVAEESRQLCVSLKQGAEGTLQIEVSDNGEGMPEDVLARLFTHGFTTRKDGHGFGLHSSALAAREMGGTLSARSAGRGQGAAFTLNLPFQQILEESSHEPSGKSAHSAD